MTATKPTSRARAGGRQSARHAEPSGLPTQYDERPVEDLWVEYKNEPSQPLRNFFMEKYLHLVRYNAERIYARLPDEVDIEDLMSAGLFGLMDAIDAGIGQLVDADMNEESTKLQALQVKQQLGIQALSIANSSSQSILRLFQ